MSVFKSYRFHPLSGFSHSKFYSPDEMSLEDLVSVPSRGSLIPNQRKQFEWQKQQVFPSSLGVLLFQMAEETREKISESVSVPSRGSLIPNTLLLMVP